MKYEMIFGDEKLFDGAPDECFCVAKNVYDDSVFYKEIDQCLFWHDGGTWKPLQFMSCTPIAMRRIIKEPKHWTWEDKKAGRLPEVGCDIQYIDSQKRVSVIAINSNEIVLLAKSNGSKFFVLDPDSLLQYYNPIETPAEKAQRLREEWCIKALSSCSILSGMQNYELKRLGGYIKDIYDALLSGKLQVPKGE